MKRLSRVNGRKAAMPVVELCALVGASSATHELKNQSPRQTAKRICAWAQAAALALAACMAAGAGAQQSPYPNPPGGAAQAGAPASAPMGDEFASGVSGVYQDAASGACDAKNGSSPNVDGYNPAFCRKSIMSTTVTTRTANRNGGKCDPIGGQDTTLAGQAGNTCYYCQQDVYSAGTNVIVVAQDAGDAAYKQGFVCAVAESDPCYLMCAGPQAFVPPPGVTQMPPADWGVKPTGPQPMKFEQGISNAPDPCYPAGPKQYNACDYPNLPRPAGCECSKTPQPVATKQPKPQPVATKQPAPQPCKNQTGTATADGFITALYKFYRSQQFTKWGAAYMVGSLMWESQGLNPNINEIGGGPGYGLGQWTNKAPFTSMTALQCYAAAHGRPVSDFVLQARFTVQQRPNITALFKTAQNAQQAQNAVTQFENFGVEGTNRFKWGAAICQNVVCSQAPPSPFYDDPKVGVPAGKGLGVNLSPALGSGAALFNLIQNLQCPWTEPTNLATLMAACMKNGGPKNP
jgi:hypothetical protein